MEIGRTVKEYVIGKWLGKGGCGECWECTKGGVKFAIKMTGEFDRSSQSEEYFANTMKMANPFIVNYVSAFKVSDLYPKKMFIVMELCPKGDLQKLIDDLKDKKGIEVGISIKGVMKIFIQLLIALHEMHSRNIIHRDLKAGNVFVNENYDIKLGDFGFARVLDDGEMIDSVLGTPYYMPPEMLCDEPKYDAKVDVWSLGVLIYYLCTLELPFFHPNPLSISPIISKGEFKPFPPHSYADEVCALFYSMLIKDPIQRPSVEALLLHPLVVSFAQQVDMLKYYHPDVLRNIPPDKITGQWKPAPIIANPIAAAVDGAEKILFVPHPGCQNNFLLRGNTASVLRVSPNPFDLSTTRAVLFLDKLIADGLWRVDIRFIEEAFGPMGFGVACDVDGQPFTVGETKLFYHCTGNVIVDKGGNRPQVGNSRFGFEPLGLEIDARAGAGHENTRAVFFVGGVPQPVSFNRLRLPLRIYIWWSAAGNKNPNQVEVISFRHLADPSPPSTVSRSKVVAWKVG